MSNPTERFPTHFRHDQGRGIVRIHREAVGIPVDLGVACRGDWAEAFDRFEAYLRDAGGTDPQGSRDLHSYVHEILDRDPHRERRALACLLTAHAASVSGKDARTLMRLARRAKRRFPIDRDPLAHAAALRLIAIAYKGDGSSRGRSKAIELLREASELKLDRGFERDCVPEFIVLSDLCRAEGRYKEAIAHMHRAVHCACGSGRPTDQMNSRLLAADLYILFRQAKKARRALSAAEDLGDRTGSDDLRTISRLRSIVKGFRPPLDADAPCACKSGLAYEACCGTADAEPIELALFERVGDERRRLVRADAFTVRYVGRALDVLVRDTDAPREGRVFTILTNDGRHDLRSFPDIATRALASARVLVDLACEAKPGEGRPEDTGLPMAVILQCTNALEAFINAAAYFIFLDGPEVWASARMPKLFGLDTDGYQYDTRFAEKWVEIGNGLFDVGWLPENRMADLKFLIGVRNELVHFKSTNVEAIVLEKGKGHPILHGLPKGIVLRPAPGTWVDRLLGADFAVWTLSLTESFIAAFREAYVAKYGVPGAVR